MSANGYWPVSDVHARLLNCHIMLLCMFLLVVKLVWMFACSEVPGVPS